MEERRLRKFFRFTEKDLDANRRGEFSADQKKRLSQEANAEQATARSSAAILLVIAAAGLAVGLIMGSIAPTPIGRILIFLLMGILWPSAWAGKAVKIIRTARTLQEPHLCQVSGPVHIIRHADGSELIQVGGFEFDLKDDPSGVVIEGDEYTIHYLESKEEILSVEN